MLIVYVLLLAVVWPCVSTDVGCVCVVTCSRLAVCQHVHCLPVLAGREHKSPRAHPCRHWHTHRGNHIVGGGGTELVQFCLIILSTVFSSFLFLVFFSILFRVLL